MKRSFIPRPSKAQIPFREWVDSIGLEPIPSSSDNTTSSSRISSNVISSSNSTSSSIISSSNSTSSSIISSSSSTSSTPSISSFNHIISNPKNRCSPRNVHTPKNPSFDPSPEDEGISSSSIISVNENQYHEVGIAFLIFDPPSLKLCQFTDTPLYSQTISFIESNSPSQILIPFPIHSQLFDLLRKKYPLLFIDIPRAMFSESLGNELIRTFSHTISNLSDKSLALSCAAATLSHVQADIHIDFSEHSLEVSFVPLEGHLFIDASALKNLQILSCRNDTPKIQTPKRRQAKATLFSILDRTVTITGARYLRSTLSSPPSNREEIISRQEAISALISSEEIRHELFSIITNAPDLSPVISYLVTPSKSTGNILLLDCFTKLILASNIASKLSELLQSFEARAIKNLVNNLESSKINELNKMLLEFLDDFIPKYQNGKPNVHDIQFAIKPGILSILDVARKELEEALSDMNNLCNELLEKSGVKFTLRSNKSRGYYLSFTVSSDRELDDLIKTLELVNVVKQSYLNENNKGLNNNDNISGQKILEKKKFSKNVTASTYTLLLLNKRYISALNDSITISTKFLTSKLSNLIPYLPSIYLISETIGILDMYLSLAEASSDLKLFKPIIAENDHYNVIRLKQLRNIILEKQFDSEDIKMKAKLLHENIQIKKMDVMLSNEGRMLIITGPNMSGKSTLLRSIAQSIIMAQIGCFIPAEDASLPLFSTIYSRAGTSEAPGSSAFFSEMSSTGVIIMAAKKFMQKALVIFDEPCTSTGPSDGLAISWAILETLLKSKCFCLCVTHIQELTALGNLYCGICLKELKPIKLEEENNQKENAIDVAAQYLPDKVIQKTKELEKMKEMITYKKKRIIKGEISASSLLNKLICLEKTKMSEHELHDFLLSLQMKIKTKKN